MLNIKEVIKSDMAVKKIRDIVESKKKTFLPSDIEIEISNDQSLKQLISVNTNNIIFGVILVISINVFSRDEKCVICRFCNTNVNVYVIYDFKFLWVYYK